MNLLGATLIALMLGGLVMGVAGHGLLVFVLVLVLSIAAGLAATLAVRTRRARYRKADEKAIAELDTAETLLRSGKTMTAVVAASRAASHAQTPGTRNAALTTLAWAALAQGYVERAKAALERIDPPHQIDLYCYAAVQSAAGRTELAINALELALAGGTSGCDATKLLIELYARRNQFRSRGHDRVAEPGGARSR